MGLNRKVSGSGMAGDCQLNFNLLGDLGLGKTSMFLRFTHHTYTDNVAPTLGELTLCNSSSKRVLTAGSDVEMKTIQIGRKCVKLYLW